MTNFSLRERLGYYKWRLGHWIIGDIDPKAPSFEVRWWSMDGIEVDPGLLTLDGAWDCSSIDVGAAKVAAILRAIANELDEEGERAPSRP